MKKISTNLWNKSWQGPKAFLSWWLLVSVVGFLFATAMITLAYFAAPWALFVFGSNLPIRILQVPEWWAALLGLELMASFMMAVGAAFVCYRIARWLFGRGSLSAPAPARGPAKPQSTKMLVVEKAKA